MTIKRRLFNILAAVSLAVWVAAGALWVWTEALDHCESINWGGNGVYRCLEFSSDDAEYYVLRDPGFAPTPLRLQRRMGGWAMPPRPSNPKALPPGSVTWFIPSPASLQDGQIITHDGLMPGSRQAFTATSYLTAFRPIGFEYASFDGWYGGGTSVRSYRISYFLILIPAAVLPVVWLVCYGVRRWKYGRFAPGHCTNCGYDLRASKDRCPECGTAMPAEETA